MMHFIRPTWFYLFIPISIYLLWIIYATKHANPWKKVCDPQFLAVLMVPGMNASRRWFHFCLMLFFSISIFALAGPSWDKAKLPIYRDVSSLMLVLDLSPAMQVADLKPTRLARAKFKIRDLINTADSVQMGLVVFTNEAFVASPLSRDANTLDAMIDELGPQMMPVSGSDIAAGLKEGLQLLKQGGAEHGNILLITASEPTADSWTVAKEIAQAGAHLNILAMFANDNSMQAAFKQLQELAKIGNGKVYPFTSDATDIQQILKNTTNTQALKDENIDNAYVWKDAGPWFCLLLIPFALMILRESSI